MVVNSAGGEFILAFQFAREADSHIPAQEKSK
jgi:hypothetical protein